MSFFFKRRLARSVVHFAPICAFVLLVSPMLGLRAWGDDLVAVLFELDDDTKLAQSCTDWLYVQHWYTVVPEPSMRVTLWALMGAGGNCHEHMQDAGERHSCPLRPRWLLRRLGHEQSMAAPVFGRMGSSRSHGPLRREQGLDNWVASIACPQRCPLQRSRRRGRGTPFPRRALLQAHRAGARLPKTPWTGPWQRRQTTRTTRPCQTRRLSLRSSTCRRLRRLHARCRTWSAASHCAWCTALDRVDVSQKNCHLHIISHRALCCLTCPLSRVWCRSVVSRVRCPVCLCSVCPAQAPRQ